MENCSQRNNHLSQDWCCDRYKQKENSALLRGAEFNKLVLNGVSGGQLPRVDLSYLLDIPVQIVPVEEQQRIIDSFHPEREMMDSAKRIIDTFSGKIAHRIKEIWGE